jgi:hypothetical protein
MYWYIHNNNKKEAMIAVTFINKFNLTDSIKLLDYFQIPVTSGIQNKKLTIESSETYFLIPDQYLCNDLDSRLPYY